MQRTGLVIKLGLALGGLLGAVFVQSLAAHSLGQKEAAPAHQVQVTYSPEATTTVVPESTFDVSSHASPVPETSTSVGFGGMLALGFGLIAVRRWKNARDTQKPSQQALELS